MNSNIILSLDYCLQNNFENFQPIYSTIAAIINSKKHGQEQIQTKETSKQHCNRRASRWQSTNIWWCCRVNGTAEHYEHYSLPHPAEEKAAPRATNDVRNSFLELLTSLKFGFHDKLEWPSSKSCVLGVGAFSMWYFKVLPQKNDLQVNLWRHPTKKSNPALRNNIQTHLKILSHMFILALAVNIALNNTELTQESAIKCFICIE
jgi:hypothetical protein